MVLKKMREKKRRRKLKINRSLRNVRVNFEEE